MGKIIFWTLVRIAVFIPVTWILFEYIEYKFWFIITIMSVYGVIIHPAVIQYRMFVAENEEVISDSLCSTCKSFDETAVLCMKYDQHPTKDDIPCNGIDWEMRRID